MDDGGRTAALYILLGLIGGLAGFMAATAFRDDRLAGGMLATAVALACAAAIVWLLAYSARRREEDRADEERRRGRSPLGP